MTITINKNACKGVSACPEGGLCIEICAMNAMSNVNGELEIIDEECTDCGLCVLNCPNEALSK
ncbi:MAG: 4Fe-4S binding protein [Methanosphaera sp.]|nr:4Fe-4S binding protein [Methanosphaera sp.]